MAKKSKRRPPSLNPAKPLKLSQATGPTPARTPLFRRANFWLWAVSIGLSVAALIIAIPQYVPYLAADISSSSVNPTSPLPVSFSASNTGVLTAYDVDYTCYMIRIRTGDANDSQLSLTNVSFGPFHLAEAMEGGTIFNFSCIGLEVDPVKQADIQIVLKFRRRFSPWPSYACARFTIKNNAQSEPWWFRTETVNCDRLARCLDADYQNVKEHSRSLREHFDNGAPMPSPVPVRDCFEEAKQVK